jgi:RsmE family RNA methyltransferase
MNLLLLEPDALSADGVVRLGGAHARHVRHVLKAQVGHSLRVGLVDGPVGLGAVRVIDDDVVELECSFEDTIPPRPAIDLLLALPRPKVLQRLWAQLAALGVSRIVVTNAARVERHYFDAHVLDPATYRPLLIEGLQQARDTRVPIVSIHRQFRILVEDDLDAICPQRARLVAHPGEAPVAGDVARGHAGERVLLAVGPEGGWNDFELGLLASRGFQPVSLGPRALRSDTACVALLAVLSEALRPAG